jgi:cytochrome P450
METLLGEGIFNRDDQQWKMHRSIARPFFARDRISDFEGFERHTARTMSLLSSLSSSGQPCEVQDLYARFTLDSASEFLFGTNLDTLSASLPVAGEAAMGPKGSATHDTWGSFAQSFEAAQQIIATRGRLGYFWPLFEFFGDKTAPHIKTIHRWLDPIVEKVLDDKTKMEQAGVRSPVEDKTFLQHLADSSQDHVLIRDQLLNMLLASRDTTACLLTYITYFMAIYPDVTRKLRAEVQQQYGPNGAPTYESIRNLRYMRAVINETLRLFPPVPLNVRESRPSSCALPASDPTYSTPSCYASREPLYMPGNTTIMYLPLLTQRNPALWGEDADEFDPERWIDPHRLKRFTSNPMMFTPFSAGPRVCVGQNYAYNEACCFLVRLLQRFDTFTLCPEFQPEGSLPPPEWKTRQGRQSKERVWPGAALTLYVKGGMWVRFGKSQNAAAAAAVF